jgi:hypothetical protein
MLAASVAAPAALADTSVVLSLRLAEGTPPLGPGDAFTAELHLSNTSGDAIRSVSFLDIAFDSDMLEWDLTGAYESGHPEGQIAADDPNAVKNLPFASGVMTLVPPKNYGGTENFGPARARLSFTADSDFSGSGILAVLHLRVNENLFAADKADAIALSFASDRQGAGVTGGNGELIDNVTLTPMRLTVVTYQLTVNAGEAGDRSGAGQYAAGKTAVIRAGERPTDLFNGWTSNTHPSIFAGTGLTDAVFSFTMPAEPVTVTATWITDPTTPITMTVNSAGIDAAVAPSGAVGMTASGSRIPGRTVTVNAGTCQNHVFGGWTASDPSVHFADPKSAETTITVPAANVTLTANWLPTYTVNVNGGGSVGSGHELGKSGFAGRYLVGETVVVFSGTRAGHNFSAWAVTGGAVLAKNDAMTTTFAMPANNVSVTASWEMAGAPAFPTNLRGVANTGGNFGIWGTGAVAWTGSSGAIGTGINREAANAGTQFFNVTNMAQSVAAGGNIYGVEVTVAANGGITARGFHSAFNGAAITWNNNGQISHNPDIPGITFVSYGANRPAGHTAGRFPIGASPFAVTVNDSHAAGAASGAGNHGAGRTVAVNAGTHPDRAMQFAGWTVNAGNVDLDDETAAVTYFTMPNTVVEVTANWEINPDLTPNVYWPNGLTAAYGSHLRDIPLPGNVADSGETKGAATPGHFEWRSPGNTVGTVTGSPHNHYVEFVPDVTVRDTFDQYYHQSVPVAVTKAVPTALDPPDALTIGEGDPLSGYALTGGSTGIIPGASTAAGGVWAWANPAVMPNATGPQQVIFTPNQYSRDNYEWSLVPNGTWNGTAVTGLTVSVTVSKRNLVTVIGSESQTSGQGSYLPGASVTVYAGETDGKSFNGWTSDTHPALFSSTGAGDSSFSFEMPAEPVTVTANWIPTYSVTVVSEGNNSSGGGYYRENALVTVHPGTNPGFNFTGWEVTLGGLLTITSNTFNMPARDVVLTAAWELSPDLSVHNRGVGFVQMHTGSGWWPEYGYGPHSSGFLNFSLAKPGVYTLTLPAYNGGNGNLHLNQGVHLIRPADGAALLPVTVSIEVNGEIRVADRPMIEGSFTNYTAATHFGGFAQNGGPNMSGFALPGHTGGVTAVINGNTPSLRNNNPPMTVFSYMIDGANGGPSDATLAATPGSDAAAITPLNAGAIVRIIFEVGKDAPPQTYPVTVNGAKIGDFEQGETVNFTAGNAPVAGMIFGGWDAVGIAAPTGATGSFTMPTGAVTLTAKWERAGAGFGDIDGDGVIDAADITLLRRYIAAENKNTFLAANPRFNLANALLLGQGTDGPGAADVARLRQFVAGFDVSLGTP